MADEIKYKFENVTPGWVGAVVLDDNMKPKGIPVAPGDAVWLTQVEQRLTAEAPRFAQDNPFVREWQCPVAWSTDGEPTHFEARSGELVLSQEAPRPILTDRAMPDLSHATSLGAGISVESGGRPILAHQEVTAGEDPPAPVGDPQEVTGAPPDLPRGPAPEGQPAPGEVIGTEDAPQKDAEHFARAEAARVAAEEQARIAAAQEADEARAAATRAAKDDAALTGRARAAQARKAPALI